MARWDRRLTCYTVVQTGARFNSRPPGGLLEGASLRSGRERPALLGSHMNNIHLRESDDNLSSSASAPACVDALLPHHRLMLEQASGIAPEIIRARGYRSIYEDDSYTQLRQLGFAKAQSRLAPGLLVPFLGRRGEPVL
jgi:hypothetical protein